jgi:hypothetical protein
MRLAFRVGDAIDGDRHQGRQPARVREMIFPAEFFLRLTLLLLQKSSKA